MPGRAPPSPDHSDDLALVGAIRSGSREAWNTLVVRHQDVLYATCVRMVGNREWARDLTQDAFVRIVRAIDRYDGRAKLSTWMVRIAMNVCLSALRAEKIRKHASLDAPVGRDSDEVRPSLDSGEPEPGQGVEDTEAHRAVLAGLQSLELEPRAILVLRDVRGLDYEQIAEFLEIPLGTVKSRLFRARAALRRKVEEILEHRNDLS